MVEKTLADSSSHMLVPVLSDPPELAQAISSLTHFCARQWRLSCFSACKAVIRIPSFPSLGAQMLVLPLGGLSDAWEMFELL